MPEWLSTLLIVLASVSLGWILNFGSQKIKEFRSLLVDLKSLSASYNDGVNQNIQFVSKMVTLAEENNATISAIHRVGEVQAQNVLFTKQLIEDIIAQKEKLEEEMSPEVQRRKDPVKYYSHTYVEDLLAQGLSKDEAIERASEAFHADIGFQEIPSYTGEVI